MVLGQDVLEDLCVFTWVLTSGDSVDRPPSAALAPTHRWPELVTVHRRGRSLSTEGVIFVNMLIITPTARTGSICNSPSNEHVKHLSSPYAFQIRNLQQFCKYFLGSDSISMTVENPLSRIL